MDEVSAQVEEEGGPEELDEEDGFGPESGGWLN
jgi:hypothetical protein